MTIVRLGLIVAALACAEPTALDQRPAAPAIVERPRNSYSIDPLNQTMHVTFGCARNEGGERVNAFIRRMFESADSAGATRLVVDVRSVSGSDTFVLVPLLKGVIARDRFRERGGLFVIVGGDSFSPRQNAATLLQKYANPILVRGPVM